MVDIHYPSKEMLCSSKISCISWNPYHKSTLASSDYDCSVIVWDVATGQRVKEFKEYQKRCWSDDSNNKTTPSCCRREVMTPRSSFGLLT